MLTFLQKPKNLLLLLSGVFLIVFVALHYKDILPLDTPDFLFIAFLFALFSFYRPGWSLCLFIAFLPLEIINAGSSSFDLHLRPYQLLGVTLIVTIVIRIVIGTLSLPRLRWQDGAVACIGIGGFLAIAGAQQGSMAFVQAVIVVSFIALYATARVFIQKVRDIKNIVPFVLLSGFFVTIFGLFQNWRFTHDLSHGEIFPGRPNVTFAEPNWLGLYLVVFLAINYAIIFWLSGKSMRHKMKLCDVCIAYHERYKNESPHTVVAKILFFFQTTLLYKIFKHPYERMKFLLSCALVPVYMLLMITVARSAWLGVAAVVGMFLLLVFFRKKNKLYWHGLFKALGTLVVTIFASANLVYALNLTDFELGKRAASATGLQEITVSCNNHSSAEALGQLQYLEHLKQLESLGCRHINLEDVENEKTRGRFVTTVLRSDPNVDVRKDIYTTSWALIKNNWLVGIGWGSASAFLGTDGHGTPLNPSNVFLQIWLGAGLLGVISFCALIVGLSYCAAKKFLMTQRNQTLSAFTLLTLTALIVPNLFNAGLLLGFVWVLLGVLVSIKK